MLLILASLAFANDVSAGYLFPGAGASAKGSASVGVSGGMLFGGGDGTTFLTLDASVAPTERLGFRVSFLTGGEGSPTAGLAGGAVGVRYLVVDTEKLRVAPFATGGVGALTGEQALGGLAAGLSLEAGGKNVWFDCSVPLVGALISPDGFAEDNVAVIGFPLTALGSELGVNAKVAEHHHFRAGLASAVPVLSYRYQNEHWYLGVTGGTLPIGATLSALSIQGGARF